MTTGFGGNNGVMAPADGGFPAAPGSPAGMQAELFGGGQQGGFGFGGMNNYQPQMQSPYGPQQGGFGGYGGQQGGFGGFGQQQGYGGGFGGYGGQPQFNPYQQFQQQQQFQPAYNPYQQQQFQPAYNPYQQQFQPQMMSPYGPPQGRGGFGGGMQDAMQRRYAQPGQDYRDVAPDQMRQGFDRRYGDRGGDMQVGGLGALAQQRSATMDMPPDYSYGSRMPDYMSRLRGRAGQSDSMARAQQQLQAAAANLPERIA
jgi:hypothetical protein